MAAQFVRRFDRAPIDERAEAVEVERERDEAA
jgi:hypothetical protein